MPPAPLAVAFAADLLLGDPRRLPHPVVGIGRLIAGLEQLLYDRLPPRRLAGALLVVLTLALAGVLAWGLLTLAACCIRYWVRQPQSGWPGPVWPCANCTGRVPRFIDRLVMHDLDGARQALAMIVAATPHSSTSRRSCALYRDRGREHLGRHRRSARLPRTRRAGGGSSSRRPAPSIP